jgi:chromosomal replication initiator protein
MIKAIEVYTIICDGCGKDHATVLHACKKVKNLIFSDKAFKKQIKDIEKLL